jgi:hypothetical protein
MDRFHHRGKKLLKEMLRTKLRPQFIPWLKGKSSTVREVYYGLGVTPAAATATAPAVFSINASGTGAGLFTFTPDLSHFMSYDDWKTIGQNYKYWKVLELILVIRVAETLNLFKAGGATSTNTELDKMRPSEFEPEVWVVGNYGSFSSNPFSSANQSSTNMVPHAKLMKMHGGPNVFTWHVTKADAHEKYLFPSGTGGATTALSTLLAGSVFNQQFTNVYGSFFECYYYSNAASFAAGAAGWKFEVKGGIVFEALDNIEYTAQVP